MKGLNGLVCLKDFPGGMKVENRAFWVSLDCLEELWGRLGQDDTLAATGRHAGRANKVARGTLTAWGMLGTTRKGVRGRWGTGKRMGREETVGGGWWEESREGLES